MTIKKNSRILRVMDAIGHKPTTPVPTGELIIDIPFANDFLKWQGFKEELSALTETDLLMRCCLAMGHDLICLQAGNAGSSDSLKNLHAIDSVAKGGFFVFWVVNGAFQMATEQLGLMDLLMAVSRSAGKLGDQLKTISDQVIATIRQGIDQGAHGIILADDIAYQKSTYTSPGFIEQYLLPIWKSQIAAAREHGIPIFFHSDGNLNSVLPYIVAAGFDGLQCIEPVAGMDILSIKKKYGHKLCLMGNVDPSLLLPDNSRDVLNSATDDLEQVVKKLLDSAAQDGGLILGTCSGLHHGMSPQRVDYMRRLASDR